MTPRSFSTIAGSRRPGLRAWPRFVRLSYTCRLVHLPLPLSRLVLLFDQDIGQLCDFDFGERAAKTEDTRATRVDYPNVYVFELGAECF